MKLTWELARRVRRVIAVEKDEQLIEKLAANIQKERIQNVTLIAGDILTGLYRSKIGTESKQKYKVVANIPYYLTSRLIRLLLEADPLPETIIFTIQKEVAQRIIAKPPKMNLLALSVQALSKPKIIKTVPAECFYPKPKVESSIILLSDISDKFFKNNKIDQKYFFSILKLAFSQKRKLLTNTLKNIADKGRLEFLLESAGLKKTARPQEVSLKQWLDIITKLEKT